MHKFSVILLALCLWACHSGRQLSSKANLPTNKIQLKRKQIDLKLQALTAHDIQENLTLHDELLISYSLIVVEKDSVVKAARGTHYLGNVKKGAKISLDTLKVLRVELQEGQKIGIQLALWEIDDYTKSQKFLNKVSNYSDALRIPIAFMEWSSVTNPLGWFLWGTRLSSMGLSFLATLDQDDLMGISEVTWTWDDLTLLNRPKFKRIHWKGKDSKLNSFHYEFGYEIMVKDIVK